MRPLWADVKSALSEFAQAIPEGDELEVRVFSSGVRGLTPPAPANAVSRERWQATFRDLSPPTGERTDLGAAAESAVRSMRAAPPGQLTFVFILTDGAQDPDARSDYPAKWAGGWPRLLSEASTVSSSRAVTFAVLRLSSRADNTLLRRLLPSATHADALDAPALRTWFARLSREVLVDKLRLVIARDLERPAFTLGASQSVTLGNFGSSHTRLSVTSMRSVVETVIQAPYTFESEKFELTVPAGHGRTASSVEAVASRRGRTPWLPPQRSRASVSVATLVSASLEPRSELTRIGIEAGPRPDSVRFAGSVVGASLAAIAGYWTIVAVAVGVAAVLLLTAKWRSHKAVLVGSISLEDQRGNSLSSVDLTPLATATYVVPAPDGSNVVRFDARNRRGRTEVMVVPLRNDVQYRGRVLTRPERISGSGFVAFEQGSVNYFFRA